jgi:hypothetical protein
MASSPFAWLLFDSDWSHTRQSAALIRHCSDVVPIGRLKWIPDSKFTGKDNAAWYRFEAAHCSGPIFHGRGAAPSSHPTRTCACGTPFRPLRSDGRHCSPACRQRAYRERLSVTEDAMIEDPNELAESLLRQVEEATTPEDGAVLLLERISSWMASRPRGWATEARVRAVLAVNDCFDADKVHSGGRPSRETIRRVAELVTREL